MNTVRPRLSLWEIFCMSFGFMGIQFGFGLQLANMSAIYAKLGADAAEIPLLWLAGPVTGLLVQPIIGSMSDRTWTRLGRRRPYFLVGAIAASCALFAMPDSPTLWFAATMLWILDASINVSMEPFRAFVADKLPPEQRTTGFVMQSFFIGIGAAIANELPAIFQKFGVVGNAANGIPLTVQYSFKLGAVAFLICVLWTVFTSKEYPPEDMAAFERKRAEGTAFEFRSSFWITGLAAGLILATCRGMFVDGLAKGKGLFEALNPLHLGVGAALGAAIGGVLSGREVSAALVAMPRTMKRLAVVQFFTWLGLFCMWMFFGLATAQQVFGTLDPKSPGFDQAMNFTGSTMKWYSIVCFAVAFALPPLADRIGRRGVHALSLACGAVGLISTMFIHDQTAWKWTMLGVGIAWASILSMPYAMLSHAIPAERVGVYMGIFNFFIVIPEILAALCLEPIVKHFFHADPVKVVVIGGVSMLIAAACTLFVPEEGR